jgi:hypothetical protein
LYTKGGREHIRVERFVFGKVETRRYVHEEEG